MLASLAERDGLTAADALTTATVATAAIRGLLLQEILTPGVSSEDALELIVRLRH
jgi:hypothetical protein